MMPITKTGQIKSESHFHNAIVYILNSEKTENQILTSGYKINNVQNAEFEMNLTRNLARQIQGNSRKRNNEVLAHHIKQSFKPGDKLSYEEIHEIGRRTAMELTGGNHEFIVATHVDKDHIHNHIIFNATSVTDLKKFRWQKNTARLLREISDRISEEYGASILPSFIKSSHTNYEKYRRTHNYRYEIKKRLNFLLKHSVSLEDFQKKAKRLNVGVNLSKKHVTYRLLDFPQQKNVRGDNKKMANDDKYTLKGIEAQLKENKLVYLESEIAIEYEKLQKSLKKEPDVRLQIEPWQIENRTDTGLFLKMDYGLGRQGLIKIPAIKFDELKNGNFELFINYWDTFYLYDEKNQDNLFMKGATVIAQLSQDNQMVAVHKNSAMKNIHNMAQALNLLSHFHVEGRQAFEELGQKFLDDFEEIEKSISELDEKIIQLNETVKFDKSDSEKVEKVKSLLMERDDLIKARDEIFERIEVIDNVRENLKGKSREL